MGFTEGQSGHLAKHDAIDTLTATHTSQIAAGDVTNPASAAGVAMAATFARVITPEAYGAVGDGVSNDTPAWVAAAAALKAATRQGITANHAHPGAVLVAKGKYNLATLASPIALVGNVRAGTASLTVPTAYAGVALLVGHDESGKLLQGASMELPDVLKAFSAIVVGSVGIRVQNLYSSTIRLGRVMGFEMGAHFTGLNHGTCYNTVSLGWISACKMSIVLQPLAGGWVNQNAFMGGGVQQDSSMGANRSTGYRHLLLDGAGINVVTGNTFLGSSFEGDISEYAIEFNQASDNVFLGSRHESGTPEMGVAVAGSTLTSASHGLVPGNVVSFLAASAPGGMLLGVPYFVISVPTAGTFTAARSKAGPAATFTTAGSGVTARRPHAVKYTSANCLRNTILHPYTTNGILEQVFTGLAGGSNSVTIGPNTIADDYADSDAPIFRARNSAGAASRRPAFAAYPISEDPVANPDGWTTAIGDRGLLFQENGAESVRLWGAGAIFSRRPADAYNFEVPTVRRSGGYVLSITSLSCAALTTTTATVSLAGCSVGDMVTVTPQGGLPAGLGIAYAYVSNTDTITIGFLNVTASAIALTKSLNVIAARQYY